MADFEREVTPATETLPPHSNLAPFSFRVDGIKLTQSGSRLVVINYFKHRTFTCFKCICLLSCSLCTQLPPLSYWSNLFHHATLPTMLSAVMAANWRPNPSELLMFPLIAVLYLVLVTGDNLHGFVLDRRNSTVKAAGGTRPLTDLEAIRVIATWVVGRPKPYPCLMVQLVWSVERKPSWWQLREQHKNVKTSLLGIFTYPEDAADVEKLAQAVAKFAGVSVQHKTISKNSV